jgi:hypothetical protein
LSAHEQDPRTRDGDAQDLLSQVTQLRQRAFELIGDMARRGLSADGAQSKVPQHLQDAANSLGAAQGSLTAAGVARGADESGPGDSDRVRISQEAAIVLALASTALPLASSALDEAECWLRTLRLYGVVGDALHSLGVLEKPLQPASKPGRKPPFRRDPTDSVDRVRDQAEDLARNRASTLMTTADVLFSVLAVYGGAFDRALYARGVTRSQLLERLLGLGHVRETPADEAVI